jgi:hypothetical protein
VGTCTSCVQGVPVVPHTFCWCLLQHFTGKEYHIPRTTHKHHLCPCPPTLSVTSVLGSGAVTSHTSTTSGRAHACFSSAIFMRCSSLRCLRLSALAAPPPSEQRHAGGMAQWSEGVWEGGGIRGDCCEDIQEHGCTRACSGYHATEGLPG